MPEEILPATHLRVAHVVAEDGDEITVVIQKDENRVIPIVPSDKYFTMLFLTNQPDGSATSWLPWEGLEG